MQAQQIAAHAEAETLRHVTDLLLLRCGDTEGGRRALLNRLSSSEALHVGWFHLGAPYWPGCEIPASSPTTPRRQ